MKLIKRIFSGILSGAIGGMSGGFFFAVGASVWVIARNADPSPTLATLVSGLVFGLLGGSLIGLIFGTSVVFIGINHRWSLIGGLCGAVVGPLPLIGILSSFGQGLELISEGLLGLAVATLAGGLGGLIGGYLFELRLKE